LNLTIDGSIGVENSIKVVTYKITTADSLLPAGKTQGESRFQQQNPAVQPGFVALTNENRVRCLDDVN
tara:strand:+ start:236 stop:439 length:204 start_codon:yes stop_codon:yes gene_type:complete